MNVELIKESPFIQWAYRHRFTLLVAIALIYLQMQLWKQIFPYPNFIPDSFSYIDAAQNKYTINVHAIGYSIFLEIVAVFSKSHLLLIWTQYVLIQIAITYLIFLLSLILKPGLGLFRFILFTAVCNPLTYLTSNLISPDTLFASLSLIWFAQLLALIYKPSLTLIISHAITILFAFTVQYTSYHYLIISIAVLLFLKISKLYKAIGISSICLLIISFIGYSQYQYKQKTGWTNFAPEEGWQLANNALFAYSHILPKDRKNIGYHARQLQLMVDHHLDSLNNLTIRPDARLDNYYLSNSRSPLIQHMYHYLQYDKTIGLFSRWSWMGLRYRKFGKYLISNYLNSYCKYYLLPNLLNYYLPSLEYLSVDDKTNKLGLKSIFKIISFLPATFAVLNYLFLSAFIVFLSVKGFSRFPMYIKQIYHLLFTVFVANTIVNVFHSPVVLRFQTFPMLTTQIFVIYLIYWIFQDHSRISIKTQELRI